MLSNVLRSSSVLIVLKVIVDSVGTAALSHEPHEIWNVHFLGKVFDVEPAVDYLSVLFALLIEGHQERAGQPVDQTPWEFEHLLDLLVAKVSFTRPARLLLRLLLDLLAIFHQ